MEYDVVIVGSGIAGALTAAKLSEQNVKVLMLEAGDELKREHNLNHYYLSNPYRRTLPNSPYSTSNAAPYPASDAINSYYVQQGSESNWFKGTYLRAVGGSTNHWLGTAIRFHPDDFKLFSFYQQGIDWPIDYDGLEPWYIEAEKVIGVAGDNHDDYGSPRSAGYPMPKIPQSYSDLYIKSQIKDFSYLNTPITITATPQARNSVDNYQGRPQCCGSGSCIPICPVQAKYDATVHVKLAEKQGAHIKNKAVVHKLLADEDGTIRAAKYLDWDGKEHKVKAKVFIIAANAIETPKLLLNSATEQFPKGIANSSDQVGRNLMDHFVQLSYAQLPQKIYPFRGPLTTSGIESLRNGSFRVERAAFRTEIANTGWQWAANAPLTNFNNLVKKNIYGKQLREQLQQQVLGQVQFSSLVEVLPNPDYRVTLADETDQLGIPRPKLNYGLDDYCKKGLACARDFHNSLFKKLNATDIHHWDDSQRASADHIMGTHRMGKNAKNAVVNTDLQSHDHQNLFLLGCGVFPTGGCSNPTLTLAALVLRSINPIIRQLND